jgi:uncharacterized protein (DUF2252 family)
MASAARGSDLPGVTTARMMEQIVEGYEQSFAPAADADDELPTVVQAAMKAASKRTWKDLARERIDRPVFVRELLPQDLKFDVADLTCDEAMKLARFLATVVGKAHARQMDEPTRKAWQQELDAHHSKTLEAPSWLWASVVDLLATHEKAYLEHCRVYATQAGLTTAVGEPTGRSLRAPAARGVSSLGHRRAALNRATGGSSRPAPRASPGPLEERIAMSMATA